MMLTNNCKILLCIAAAVDASKVQVLRPSGHETRTGGIDGTISTNTQNYSFKHRSIGYERFHCHSMWGFEFELQGCSFSTNIELVSSNVSLKSLGSERAHCH